MTKFYHLYLFILILTTCTGLFRLRQLDQASKFICLLVGFNLIVESTAYAAARLHDSNMIVYGIATPIQTVIACLYFNYGIEAFKRRKVGILIATISLVMGVLNTVFLQPLGHFPSYFLTISGALIVGLTLVGYFHIFNGPYERKLTSLPEFWFLGTFLFFWIMTAVFWCAYDYFGQETQDYAAFFNYFILSINLVYYLSIGLIFLLYPKVIKQAHES